jgi:NAD(P)-dependent dehydrogenase (short-subunit alcohol dehydrogenase family)
MQNSIYNMFMKTVLITGANRGLGLGFTKVFLKQGYKVIASCRDPQSANDLISLSRVNPDLYLIKLDVASDSSIVRAVDAVEALELDTIDILINNVGVNSRTINPDADKSRKLIHLDRKVLGQMFDINAVAPILVVKEFLSFLKRSGRAVVVNVTSQRASFNDPEPSAEVNYGYCASKVALNMMVKELAKELAPLQIATFAVHPGSVLTEMNSKGVIAPEQAAENIAKIAEQIELAASGSFLNYDGELFPL